jgi:hypothetical protein
MGKRRLWFVNTVIVLFMSGSLYDIVRDTDHWPFSNYPMYSEVQRARTLTAMRVFGVTDESPAREVPLTDLDTLQPFDQSRLAAALDAMAAQKEPERGLLLSEALHDSLRRYENLRQAGRHRQPRLKGLKAYRLFWELDPFARNLDRPDGATLISEVATIPGGRP